MNSHPLQENHQAIHYIGYSAQIDDAILTIEYSFCLDPQINFKPTVSIPVPTNFSESALKTIEPLIHHLGTIELVSYWKAALPKEIVFHPFSPTALHQEFLRTLLKDGLSEFWYRNQLSPSIVDSVTFTSRTSSTLSAIPTEQHKGRSLLLIGGGKDSSLALSLLNPATHTALVLNPIASAGRTAAAYGFSTIQCSRTIDPQLLALNRAGYLNGHTPFSAYLAFFSQLVAAIYKAPYTIVCNERSADEPGIIWNGFEVNHQYSKSFKFETLFRNYLSSLTENSSYFSFLRPLHDLQVTKLFCTHTKKVFTEFRSCNVGQKEDRWCGACPKCAFVFLTIAPFISTAELISIFGKNLFHEEECTRFFKELLGYTNLKPFECVGTFKESQVALALSMNAHPLERIKTLKELLTLFATDSSEQGYVTAKAGANALLSDWNLEHYLPPLYESILKRALSL